MTLISRSVTGLALMSLFGVATIPGVARAADRVNINAANEQELMKLPEVNEARAKAIVSYRKSSGEFIQVEELELIPQVKPIYTKIKDLVAVE
ncbi:MAG TPA: helix-hairpin-helix domain-containing protein [Candidatus Binatia bacterium]|nr:helix-hairpin-helix domain-containing protein [Candidatus Binatia bacterium]